jgi:hypothetical protein
VTAAPEALRLFFGLVARQAGDGSARVLEDRAAIRAARHEGAGLAEFVRLPSTGGAYVLASTNNARDFKIGLEGLTLSRPVWRLARRMLGALSPLGVHRWLGLPELAVESVGVQDRSYSLQVGVPGGGQKLIVREWGPRGHDAFWKLGPAGLPAQLVEAEAEALRWLADHAGGEPLAPALFDCGADEDAAWIKMAAMGGKRPANDLGEAAEDFLYRLAATQRQDLALSETAWFRRLERRLSAIEAGAPELVKTCRCGLAGVQSQLSGPLPFHPSHGDFTPWNTRLEGATLRAFDWEFFDPAAPALLDWFHWIIQTGVLVERLSMQQVLERLQRPTRLLPAAAHAQREALLQLYLVDMLTREEEIMQHERPEFVQVEWLRSARLDLLEGKAA